MSPTATLAPAAPLRDDMLDTDADFTHWPLLAEQLKVCKEILEPTYLSADQTALSHQKVHARITVAAAVLGAVAVLAAIVGIGKFFEEVYLGEHFVRALEIVSAFSALMAVGLGIYAASQRQWLLDRHKAERCRLAKFRYLVDPAAWTHGHGSAMRTGQFRQEAQAIAGLTHGDLEQWMGQDDVAPMPVVPPGAEIPVDVRRELVRYYFERRLDVQSDYFGRRAQDHHGWDRLLRDLGPACFYGSVIFALVHVIVDALNGFQETWLGKVTIVFAAALPVIGGAARTIRLAFEFARNTLRYAAKQDTLQRCKVRLVQEDDPSAAFRDLWICEHLLDVEHREWLRLMKEAEWFG